MEDGGGLAESFAFDCSPERLVHGKGGPFGPNNLKLTDTMTSNAGPAAGFEGMHALDSWKSTPSITTTASAGSYQSGGTPTSLASGSAPGYASDKGAWGVGHTHSHYSTTVSEIFGTSGIDASHRYNDGTGKKGASQNKARSSAANSILEVVKEDEVSKIAAHGAPVLTEEALRGKGNANSKGKGGWSITSSATRSTALPPSATFNSVGSPVSMSQCSSNRTEAYTYWQNNNFNNAYTPGRTNLDPEAGGGFSVVPGGGESTETSGQHHGAGASQDTPSKGITYARLSTTSDDLEPEELIQMINDFVEAYRLDQRCKVSLLSLDKDMLMQVLQTPAHLIQSSKNPSASVGMRISHVRYCSIDSIFVVGIPSLIVAHIVYLGSEVGGEG